MKNIKPSTRALAQGGLAMLFWLTVFGAAGAVVALGLGMGYISEWFAGFFTALIAVTCIFVCDRVYRVTGEVYFHHLRHVDHG